MDSNMNDGNDDTDKLPSLFRQILGKSKEKPPEQASNDVVPTIDGYVDSDDYSMKFPLGKCLIFNHKIFINCPERKGNHDVRSLYNQFRKLGFDEVKVFNDYTVRKVRKELEKVAKEDHSKNSCLICCILTHGDMGLLHAQDGVYPVNVLYDIFNGSASPTLRGKPKIFFIQACQGDKTESGAEVIYEKKESVDSAFKISIHADFLIMFSSFPGFVSFKNEYIGSYFIQCLCEVLKEHAENKHLMDMLTIVTRRIAFYFESHSSDEIKDKKKQVPYITTTLTKNVKFPPKLST